MTGRRLRGFERLGWCRVNQVPMGRFWPRGEGRVASCREHPQMLASPASASPTAARLRPRPGKLLESTGEGTRAHLVPFRGSLASQLLAGSIAAPSPTWMRTPPNGGCAIHRIPLSTRSLARPRRAARTHRRRGGRAAEGAPLLREYGLIAHRGFESLPLRQNRSVSCCFNWLFCPFKASIAPILVPFCPRRAASGSGRRLSSLDGLGVVAAPAPLLTSSPRQRPEGVHRQAFAHTCTARTYYARLGPIVQGATREHAHRNATG